MKIAAKCRECGDLINGCALAMYNHLKIDHPDIWKYEISKEYEFRTPNAHFIKITY